MHASPKNYNNSKSEPSPKKIPKTIDEARTPAGTQPQGSDCAPLPRRAEKLLNSKLTKKKCIIVKFALLGTFFLTYFILNLALREYFVSNCTKIYNMMTLVMSLPYQVKFTYLFTYSSLSQSLLSPETSKYRSLIYSTTSQIDTAIKTGLPSSFDQFTRIHRNTDANICSEGSFLTSDCEDSEYLLLGSKTVNVKIAENTQELLLGFAKDPTKNFDL